MLETGRRSAISSSELGLYSDRGDRYNRNRYSSLLRKFTIGVMVVVAVILVAIFVYDFTSATSVNSKVNQETKHIYILQNAFKKPWNVSRKPANATISPERDVNKTSVIFMQDRSDDGNYENVSKTNETDETLTESRAFDTEDPEYRSQNLNNFKLRKRILKSIGNERAEENPEGKQLFDNHAVVYRVRQRYKYPNSEEDASSEEARPTPFHWEFKTPHPSAFKRPKYPQLSQYRYPHSSRNIQDIIKYLTNDAEVPNRGIKFTGVYVNPKKYDLFPELGEMVSSSDRSEEDEGSVYPYTMNGDPFYQYKPKHPSDVNLLATSNVRFSPTGLHRYNPYYDPLYPRPVINYKPSSTESQYENLGSFPSNNFGKKRKQKPFSVMLDIYPITDIVEQNKKNARPRPQIPLDDYDLRRPIQYNRGPKFYVPPQSVPAVALPSQSGPLDEDERQQMIFHLNLYPRRKNKLNRHDVIHRSETMLPEERQQFVKKLMSPLESIAKHLTDHSAIEESKFQENQNKETTNLPVTRYQESTLDLKEDGPTMIHLEKDEEKASSVTDNESNVENDVTVPANHKVLNEEDYTTEKYEFEKIVTTPKDKYEYDEITTLKIENENEPKKIGILDDPKDIDTIEGFQRFSDSLLATE